LVHSFAYYITKLFYACLALNYLLTYKQASCPKKEIAKFISFLTSYSENTVVQKLSTLHKKGDENYIAYEKDMKVVRKYFEKLGLIEVVKMIDNDLENF
jgi:sulfite reductase alpha subunit-like flavoprotein